MFQPAGDESGIDAKDISIEVCPGEYSSRMFAVPRLRTALSCTKRLKTVCGPFFELRRALANYYP